MIHLAQQEKNEYTFATWKFYHRRSSIDKGVVYTVIKSYDYCRQKTITFVIGLEGTLPLHSHCSIMNNLTYANLSFIGSISLKYYS